jgi:hypothetical protein
MFPSHIDNLQIIVQVSPPFASCTMSTMEQHQPHLYSQVRRAMRNKLPNPEPFRSQLLPHQMAMTRSVSSSPPAFSQLVTGGAGHGYVAQTSLYSLALAAAEEVQLPPRLYGSSVSSSQDSAMQPSPAPASASASGSSAPLYPNAFNVEFEYDLQPRSRAKDCVGQIAAGDNLSTSLTISKETHSPQQSLLQTDGFNTSNRFEGFPALNTNSAAAAAVPSVPPSSSSSAASSSSATLAALSDFGVTFSWTRGEMIGRGGFGVV